MTPEQEEWMRLHFKHTKNAEIASRFGWSETTMHRFAREMGLTKTPQFQAEMQRNAVQKAKESCLRNNSYPPKGYHIPNSELYRFKKGERNVDRLGEKGEKERIAKVTASRRETVRKERARILFGLEQKTKMKLIKQPKKAVDKRLYLRKLGYIIPRGSMVVYYDENTKRSFEMENRKRGDKYYVGFTFKPKEQ